MRRITWKMLPFPPLSSERDLHMKRLWCLRSDFSKMALDATTQYPVDGNRTDATASAGFFLDYTSTFLIRKPADLLYVLEAFERKEDRTKFMNIYFGNGLIDPVVPEMLLHDEETISLIGSAPEWSGLPIRLRARHLIESSAPNSLSVQSLIPIEAAVSPSTIEYVLSWAYEEGKLSELAISYFARRHEAKFKRLTAILISLGTEQSQSK